VKTNFCNVCKKVGHNSERCYFNQNQDGTKDLNISALSLPSIELDSSEGNESDAGESVYMLNTKNKSYTIYIPVQLIFNNQTLALRGLIDTGSDKTVLNKKWIDKEEKDRATASQADGSQKNDLYRLSNPIIIKTTDNEHKLRFYCTHNLHCELILGIDWISGTGYMDTFKNK
jgi:Retroviral aspartyl protease